jgi:hypothetical protein
MGAIKIKDGLFIGDEFSAQDLEFIVANKVTHVINCAGKQIKNLWEHIGVIYLTFNWQDHENQILFDQQDRVADQIFDFIEVAAEQTESVLVHSVRGQSRASCVLACYLMRKYSWSLLKTLEFLNSRRPDLEVRVTFIKQLSDFEHRLKLRGFGPQTKRWNELSQNNVYLESEELLLRNTFLNAKTGVEFQKLKTDQRPLAHSTRRNPIRWVDQETKGRKVA